MSNTAIDRTLADKITELEQKSSRIEQSKDTEDKVAEASRQIGRICIQFDDVTEKAEELRFYVRLYEDAFANNEERPGGIQPQVRIALQRVEITDDELLEAAQNERLQELEDRVREAAEKVDGAIETITDAIEAAQSDWKGDLESAEELNKIIGGDSGFQDLIVKMRRFLDSEMWNPGKDPSQLTAQWNRYERKWRENEGKHGWSTFQAEHDLNDSTVEELKQFTDDDPVRLSDLSLSTLKEIKRVPELDSALQLEVRS